MKNFKVFLNKNWEILLETLAKMNCPLNIIKFIKFIIHERYIYTDKSGNSHRNVHKDVPQGVLSPLLFCLYIANITKNIPKSSFISMYADDVAILVKKKSLKSSISIMEKTINIISNNLRNLGLEFAPHKTVLIHFNDQGIKPNQTKIKFMNK